jgi:hypothetical protein
VQPPFLKKRLISRKSRKMNGVTYSNQMQWNVFLLRLLMELILSFQLAGTLSVKGQCDAPSALVGGKLRLTACTTIASPGRARPLEVWMLAGQHLE